MPSFGYGVGDFIAVGTLVGQVLKGLAESRDASNDCQSLIATLQSISAAIETAGSIFDTGRGNPASVNGIKHELAVCERLISRFLEDSKEFTKMSCNVDNKSYIINELRKISWTMFKTGDIQRLQRDLQGHLHALNVYTNLLQCNLLLQTTKPLSTPVLAPVEPPESNPGTDTQIKSTGIANQDVKHHIPMYRNHSRGKLQSPIIGKRTDSGYSSSQSARFLNQPLSLDNITRDGDDSSILPDSTDGSEISDNGLQHEEETDQGPYSDSEASISLPLRERRTQSPYYSNKASKPQSPRYTTYRMRDSNDQEDVDSQEFPETTARPHQDPEMLRMQAELKAWKDMEEKAKAAEKQRELEAQIRKDAEEAFQRRLEDMRVAQEEAKKDIEKARKEAERAAREHLEEERKAEEARQKQHAEEIKMAEERARVKFEALIKAADEKKQKEEEERRRTDEAARLRLEAAIKAEQEAKAAAEKRSAEEFAMMKQMRDEERQKEGRFSRYTKMLRKPKVEET